HSRAFVEKPDLSRAQIYLDDQQHLWNCSLFSFTAGEILTAMQHYAQPIFDAIQALMPMLDLGASNISLDRVASEAIPKNSIDYAVMEQARNVCVIKTDMEWRDIGSWGAVHEFLPHDDNRNATHGNVTLRDTTSSLVMTQNREGAARTVTVVGMDNLLLIDTPDALLVTNKEHAQEIKDIALDLQKAACVSALEHVTNYRPWGHYTILDESAHHKVKRLTINPEQGISLQMHHHRSEHWVVVQGQAMVINGKEEEFLLKTNESTYIPASHRHRVRNPSSSTPLIIAEVQTGNYLGEDDIVRFDDIYGRT
ncbi:MAG: cupin domain-containing protein, partial [Pseudomonadota bacterium]